MACCAFAFFIVSQLLWPLRWLRAQFGVSRNDVVAWSRDGAPMSDPIPARAVASTAALTLAAAALLIATTTALASHEEICATHVARGS
jgi:hypothetical protein